MIINAISGFSASSRKNEDTLRGFLGGIFKGLDMDTNEVICIPSANPVCVKKSLLWIWHNDVFEDENLLLIGKSLGAVRTWWLAYNHWDEIKHFKKIRIILIDPHGWQRGDGRWGSYGRKMFNGKWRNLRASKKWLGHLDLQIVNLHQCEDFPRGARFEYDFGSGFSTMMDGTIRNIKLPPGANHWNCTDIKTETGQYVAGIIRDVVEGLE